MISRVARIFVSCPVATMTFARSAYGFGLLPFANLSVSGKFPTTTVRAAPNDRATLGEAHTKPSNVRRAADSSVRHSSAFKRCPNRMTHELRARVGSVILVHVVHDARAGELQHQPQWDQVGIVQVIDRRPQPHGVGGSTDMARPLLPGSRSAGVARNRMETNAVGRHRRPGDHEVHVVAGARQRLAFLVKDARIGRAMDDRDVSYAHRPRMFTQATARSPEAGPGTGVTYDQARLTSPPITVLVPVDAFHRHYLHEALDSLIAQTSDAWRALIITEQRRTRELTESISEYLQDGRIELIVNQGRKLAGAFNTGMRRASSEFVAILFGDDIWSADAVAVLSDAIRAHPEADFFHSSRRIIDERGHSLSSVHMSRSDVRLQDFGSPSPVKHLLCWRRSLALSFGGMDESLNSVGPDDFDFPWLMAEHGAVFCSIPQCLYLYRDHRNSFRLTTHLPLSVHTREIQRILRKHGVDPDAVEQAVHRARSSYLRQCLYRSRLQRWVKERLRLGRSSAWRETYD